MWFDPRREILLTFARRPRRLTCRTNQRKGKTFIPKQTHFRFITPVFLFEQKVTTCDRSLHHNFSSPEITCSKIPRSSPLKKSQNITLAIRTFLILIYMALFCVSFGFLINKMTKTDCYVLFWPSFKATFLHVGGSQNIFGHFQESLDCITRWYPSPLISNLLWFKLQGGAHLCFKQRGTATVKHLEPLTCCEHWTLELKGFFISFYTASGFLR